MTLRLTVACRSVRPRSTAPRWPLQLACASRASPASGSSPTTRSTALPDAAHMDNAFLPGTAASRRIWSSPISTTTPPHKDTLALKYYYQHDPTLAPYAYSSVPGFTQHLDAGAQVFSIINTYLVKSNLSTTQTLGFLREKIYGTNEQPFGPTPSPAAQPEPPRSTPSGRSTSLAFPSSTCSATTSRPAPRRDSEHRAERRRPGAEHRRLPEPPRAFRQRHLDAGQAHRQLRRELQLHAAQHHRPAHRHRHDCHRRLQPDDRRASLRRAARRRLLRHLVPAGQRQPLLPRQPAWHLTAGQVSDHAEPLAHRRRALRLGRRPDRKVRPHLQLRSQRLQLRRGLGHARELRLYHRRQQQERNLRRQQHHADRPPVGHRSPHRRGMAAGDVPQQGGGPHRHRHVLRPRRALQLLLARLRHRPRDRWPVRRQPAASLRQRHQMPGRQTQSLLRGVHSYLRRCRRRGYLENPYGTTSCAAADQPQGLRLERLPAERNCDHERGRSPSRSASTTATTSCPTP